MPALLDMPLPEPPPAAPRPDSPGAPLGRTPGQPKLSEEIDRLIVAFAEHPVKIGEVVRVLHGRAWTMLLVLLALPFCTPIQLPGLSTPFGLVIAFLGFRLSLGEKPMLPRRLMETQLPPRFFRRFFLATRRIVRVLEYFLRPRLTQFVDLPLVHRLAGFMILMSGCLLLLPLPIPFSNILPALSIVLVAASLLERDGYSLLAGTVCFVASLAFFAAIFVGGAAALEWMKHALLRGGPLDPPVAP